MTAIISTSTRKHRDRALSHIEWAKEEIRRWEEFIDELDAAHAQGSVLIARCEDASMLPTERLRGVLNIVDIIDTDMVALVFATTEKANEAADEISVIAKDGASS